MYIALLCYLNTFPHLSLSPSCPLLLSLPLLPLPCHQVVGIDPHHSSLFKSNLMPSRFGFRTTSDRLYSVSYHPHFRVSVIQLYFHPSPCTPTHTHTLPHTLHSPTPHPHTMHTPTSHPHTSHTPHHTLIPYTPPHHTSHPHQVMFKLGDDLRQDQLILQLITLMDRILRRENLDLKLTPYNVLACSSNHGKSNCTFHALFVLSTLLCE